MSAWSRLSSIKYWVNRRPLRLFRCFNIWLHLSLIYTLIHWNQRPLRIFRCFDIRFHFSLIYCPSVSILDSMSAWSRHSSIEYWVKGRPLRLFQCFNIGLHVSLIYTLIHWVLSQGSATPTVPVFQYWIACQPDLCTHTMSIESRVGHSECSSVPILDCISAWSRHSSIEYWVNLIYTLIHWVLGTLDPILKGWGYRSGWYGIEYWILGMVGVADPWPNTQWMRG
jgi:hypothetical protein